MRREEKEGELIIRLEKSLAARTAGTLSGQEGSPSLRDKTGLRIRAKTDATVYSPVQLSLGFIRGTQTQFLI